MKKLKHIVYLPAVAAAAFMFTLSGFASTTFTFKPDNLYFGFQYSSASANYIINLGPATNIINSSTVVDLSADFSSSLFNNFLGSSSSAYGGVVGGNQYFLAPDIYGTQLRVGGAGNPATPGSTAPSALGTYATQNTIASISSLAVSTNNGAGILDPTLSWMNAVEDFPNPPTGNSFWGHAFNPDSMITKNGVLYEDLYYSTGAAFTYLGYFTLDLSGSSPKFTFTPKTAPASLTKPGIQSITRSGNTVTVISTNAVAGYNYQLQYTASLNSANWVNVGTAQVAGAAWVTNTDTTATATQRFYRVEAY